MIKAVPKIQRNPRTVSQNATHYGYVAYQDIVWTSEAVQPDESPYRKTLPCRELIPFTNIEVGVFDEKSLDGTGTKRIQKTAFDCASDVERSYAGWNFKVLRQLTGLDEDAAFRIFQTIQPFHYKLKDIQVELSAAEDRIENGGTAVYEGENVDLPTLTMDEKEIARQVLGEIIASANTGVEIGIDKQQKTITSMTKAFAGGDGKVTPDPLDRKLAVEFGTKLPQLIDVQQEEAKKKTDADEREERRIAAMEKANEIEERKLALLEKVEPAKEQEKEPVKPKTK